MSVSTRVFLVLAFVLAGSVAAIAQGPFAGAKVAVIDTDMLADSKTGVTKLINAITGVETKFKPQRDEIQGMVNRLETLQKDAQTAQAKGDTATVNAKVSEGEALQRQLNFKREDAQKLFEKALQDATASIYTDISTSLTAFAKQRGIDVLIDVAKTQGAIMMVNNTVDITGAFIKEYNAKSSGVPVRP